MASFVTANASIRLSNEERRSVCSVSGISPAVSASTAAAFVTALETLYNNGPCTARLNLAMDIKRNRGAS